MTETRRDFLNDCAARYSAVTLETLERGLNAIDRFFPGGCEDVADWSQQDVDEYWDSLHGNNYSPHTVAIYFAFVLRRFLRFAGRAELLGRMGRVYRTRTYGNTHLGCDDEPIEAEILTIPLYRSNNLRDVVIIELLLWTGPRSDELTRVSLRDVDFRMGEINYGQADRSRGVPFNAALAELLQNYIHCWRPRLKGDSVNDHLLLKQGGSSFDRIGLAQVVRKHFPDSPKITPKELRHEFIRRLLNDGVPRHHVIVLAVLSHVSQTYVYMLGKHRAGRKAAVIPGITP